MVVKEVIAVIQVIDDGDLDKAKLTEPCKYQEEGAYCMVCTNKCDKGHIRKYLKVDKDKEYPKI